MKTKTGDELEKSHDVALSAFLLTQFLDGYAETDSVYDVDASTASSADAGSCEKRKR